MSVDDLPPQNERLLDFAQEMSGGLYKSIIEFESTFYKALLTISAGAIALTATVFDKLIKVDEVQGIECLYWSWGFFLFTICWVFISIIASAWYKDDYAEGLIESVRSGRIGPKAEIKKNVSFPGCVLYINCGICVLSFFIASLLLVGFISGNAIQTTTEKPKQVQESQSAQTP